jgi:hypothetical protein
MKVVDKEGVVIKEISTTKKKPDTLHRDSRKGALKTSQELTRSHTRQAKGYERVNLFERLSLEKR